jgi:hypothetical protein
MQAHALMSYAIHILQKHNQEDVDLRVLMLEYIKDHSIYTSVKHVMDDKAERSRLPKYYEKKYLFNITHVEDEIMLDISKKSAIDKSGKHMMQMKSAININVMQVDHNKMLGIALAHINQELIKLRVDLNISTPVISYAFIMPLIRWISYIDINQCHHYEQATPTVVHGQSRTKRR